MVMTLSRSGNGWSDGLHRSYDVWGSLRWNPSSSADVKQRYCANLGHVEDDASGLVYMRARFHEPWTGRFISQDVAKHGSNWFAYCLNNPISGVDPSGNSRESEIQAWIGTLLMLAGMIMMGGGAVDAFFSLALGGLTEISSILDRFTQILQYNLDDNSAYDQLIKELDHKASKGGMPKTIRAAGAALTAIAGYFVMLYGVYLWTQSDVIDPYSANEGLFSLLP